MTHGFPIPRGGDITQYEHIECVRPTDGYVLKAKRVVVDEQPPIRWRVIVEDKLGALVYAEMDEGCSYTTDELLAQAKKLGYGDWCVPPEDFVATWDWPDIDDESKKRLTPKYPLPDSVV